MNIKDIPKDWQRRLYSCVDLRVWAVFADWMEDQGDELADGVRYLVGKRKKPELMLVSCLGNNQKWVWGLGGNQSQLTSGLFYRIVKCEIRYIDWLLYFPVGNKPLKCFPSTISAYIAAAKAYLKWR